MFCDCNNNIDVLDDGRSSQEKVYSYRKIKRTKTLIDLDMGVNIKIKQNQNNNIAMEMDENLTKEFPFVTIEE